MPTINVSSSCDERLQGIADLLAKAKKVLVVTGAGVSTNAGIPDFRSENGLYALIQAQYDAAAAKSNGQADLEAAPPAKRRRLARSASTTTLTLAGGVQEGHRLRPTRSFCVDVEDDSTLEEPHLQLDIPSSSQTSSTGRRSLPNLKGKDLFDSIIWSDSFTTSIFYTFITSLRRKVLEEVTTTTKTHQFLKTLRDSGRLVRVYTQNIDGLEAREGLSMDLSKGPGSKVRFGAKIAKPKETQRKAEDEGGSSSEGGEGVVHLDRGVECVPLHGGLESLRCGLCARLASWDQLEEHTLAGESPACPHCTQNNATRENRGRRSLAIGRLRPDVVLYGEEHPLAHQIGPLVTHDISLAPDILLILGTSLRVHGLKLMVREFAKAVHTRGGNVVFVNRTKPPDSVWGDVIDYWIEADCDWWVQDVEKRRADIWLPQGYFEEKEVRPKTIPKNPQSMRRDLTSGAYLVFKIMQKLGRVSGRIIDDLPELPEQILLDAQLLGEHAVTSKADDIDEVKQGQQVIGEQPQKDTALVVGTKPMKPKAKACVNCRSRKIKCDGDRPHCKNCVSRQQDCMYRPDRTPSTKRKRQLPPILHNSAEESSSADCGMLNMASRRDFLNHRISSYLPNLTGLESCYTPTYTSRTPLGPISANAEHIRHIANDKTRPPPLPSPPTSDTSSPVPSSPSRIQRIMSIGAILSSPVHR